MGRCQPMKIGIAPVTTQATPPLPTHATTNAAVTTPVAMLTHVRGLLAQFLIFLTTPLPRHRPSDVGGASSLPGRPSRYLALRASPCEADQDLQPSSAEAPRHTKVSSLGPSKAKVVMSTQPELSSKIRMLAGLVTPWVPS